MVSVLSSPRSSKLIHKFAGWHTRVGAGPVRIFETDKPRQVAERRYRGRMKGNLRVAWNHENSILSLDSRVFSREKDEHDV